MVNVVRNAIDPGFDVFSAGMREIFYFVEGDFWSFFRGFEGCLGPLGYPLL